MVEQSAIVLSGK